ncbi:hypothetical protein BJ165DRAFT_1520499 [Panaeolus papilionaceus]|nr:hypothetical protein BJ165DRAFT_1520499 [Panaeolus papilionaceus]
MSISTIFYELPEEEQLGKQFDIRYLSKTRQSPRPAKMILAYCHSRDTEVAFSFYGEVLPHGEGSLLDAAGDRALFLNCPANSITDATVCRPLFAVQSTSEKQINFIKRVYDRAQAVTNGRVVNKIIGDENRLFLKGEPLYERSSSVYRPNAEKLHSMHSNIGISSLCEYKKHLIHFHPDLMFDYEKYSLRHTASLLIQRDITINGTVVVRPWEMRDVFQHRRITKFGGYFAFMYNCVDDKFEMLYIARHIETES